MFDFHEKRKIRGVLYSRTVIVFLCVITLILSSFAYNRYTVARDVEAKLNVKRAELEEMKSRAAAIESRVRYLQDERGIEEELRNRFDAVREGEQAVIFVGDDKHEGEGDIPEVKQGDENEDRSFMERFFSL